MHIAAANCEVRQLVASHCVNAKPCVGKLCTLSAVVAIIVSQFITPLLEV